MSIETEDSLLEEALRNDLPSHGREARLRRRLLAAGVAVGNGVATATAAASGTATTGAAATGMVAKAAALSWGVKVGLAAVVAIPTVGLWIDGRSDQRSGAPPPASVAPARVGRREPAAVVAAPQIEAQPREAVLVDEPREAAEGRVTSRSQSSAFMGQSAPESDVRATALHPSQSDFAAPEATARPPHIASTLADETRLLDNAFAELGRGNRARAAELISEHEARYPHGLLKKERDRARAMLSELSRGQ